MVEYKSTISGVKVKLMSFDERNKFRLWQRVMRNILIQQDLRMCISGIDHMPKTMSMVAWSMTDIKTMLSIELHLSNEVTYIIMEKTSTKGKWEKLKKNYMDKTLLKKFFLKDQLYNLRMEKGDDIIEYHNVFNWCINDWDQ